MELWISGFSVKTINTWNLLRFLFFDKYFISEDIYIIIVQYTCLIYR
jgi:hypothetical protein